MINLKMKECFDYMENRFVLVLVAAARSRQLMKFGNGKENFRYRESSIALKEIAAGRVVFEDLMDKILTDRLLVEHKKKIEADFEELKRLRRLRKGNQNIILNEKVDSQGDGKINDNIFSDIEEFETLDKFECFINKSKY
ncbi:MAG: DNA-directed RNA polymerase subunit omega [Deltaproteobacteria bacterium]|nr:MAG: DNA-directed RNA polymerase subunit omega [Deltaproteobacteria bacterium]